MEATQNSTRQQILELLKRTGGMTVDQLSDALGISAMGVRQHLAVLERDGLVETGKRRGGVGRPAHVYSVSEKGDDLFPKDYAGLATTVLEIIDELDGRQKVETVIRKRMERLYSALAPKLEGKPMSSRVEELARLLEEGGSLAAYGRKMGGYYLQEHNCIIARVAKRFPSVCQYELALFEKLLGTRVEREKCIAHGDACCSYFVPNGSL